MPSLRPFRASDAAAARQLAVRIGRILLVILGFTIMLAGVLIGPLPGPLGLPLIALGLIVVLRNSFAARRRFVRLERAHPKVVSPIRRVIAGDQAVVPAVWRQYLRTERWLLPRRIRFAAKARGNVMRRRRP
jgi:hypothetical protein